MSKYDVKGYIELLNESFNFIKYYDREYNKKMDSLSHKTKLRYHIFSFSQIVFALRDRLFTDHNEKHCEICKFFEKGKKATTEVGIVIQLANEWKHKGGFSLRQHYTVLKEIGPLPHKFSKVEQKLPHKHKYNNSDGNLIVVLEKCKKEIIGFCLTNKFI